MASAGTNGSKEDRIKDLLEDLDLQKLIYDDLLEKRAGESEESEEVLESIRHLETQIANLLGETVPPVPAPAAPVVSSAPLAPTYESPVQRPPAPPAGPPRISSSSRPNLPATDLSPAPYWPSSAPSPFTNAPVRERSGPSMRLLAETTRKRPRQESASSPIQSGPSKKTSARPNPRFEEIEARMQAQLAQNKAIFDELREDDMVAFTVETEDISEEQVLAEIERDEEEHERLIRAEFQMEKDAEFARMLQAQEDFSEDESRESIAQPSFSLPDRSLPAHLTAQLSLNSPDYNPTSTLLPPLNRAGYKQPTSTIQPPSLSRIGYPNSKIEPPYRTFEQHSSFSGDWGDDLQEISPFDFNPRYRVPPAAPRSLPWMKEPNSNLLKEFDLVRQQEDEELDDDDLIRYEERDFPTDIKNLLSGIKDIREATRADKHEAPEALQSTLMKHQKIGLAWMKAKEESSHRGGILADDMGLGKTVQTIALMVSRPFTDPDRRPSLIVAPKALMEQWKSELQKHIKPGNHQLSVFIFHDKQRRIEWRELKSYDVVITTFGTLTANLKALLEADKLEHKGRDASIVKKNRDKAVLFGPLSKWHRVIVDEAQNIKNPRTQSAKACSRLNATYRWCLTGTPMMNRLEDLQSLLGFLRIRPYNNKDKFKQTFIRSVRSGYGYGDTDVMAQLRVLIKAVCLRRTKKTTIDGQPILQLPPKVIEKIHVVFDEKALEMYQELEKNTQGQINRYLDAGTLGRNYSHVLVLLLRLRQACCHPHLILGFRMELPTSVPGLDLIANARSLGPVVVERLKNNTGEEDGTCPICLDSVENAVIYIPCGHSVCSECFARIAGPVADGPGADFATMIKCQNCRQVIDPLKITDGHSFKKVHDATSLPPSATEEDDQEDDDDSESYGSDDGSDSSEPEPKKKSLAELRQAAQTNKRERRKYLRRLEKTWVPSAKIEKAMEILQANEDRGKGEKTIIFSQFTSLLDLMDVPIARRGWRCRRYDGSMRTSDRTDAVRAFTDDPACKIMLVSLKAGNAGLNLVAASHVIIFDPFWNPYIEDQAVDRAHRIGQQKEVFVHRLLIENTVEDRIVELQDRKRELIDGALDEGGKMNVSRLGTRELAYLFGLRD